jgi:fibronectin-binding autotransporter adhesin
LGFGQFVDFNGGTLKTSGNLVTSRTISLLSLGGTIDSNGFNVMFLANIINSGSLTKVGTGTLTLSGTNTYSGDTNLNGGILAVSSDINLGTGPLSFNGGTLEALSTGGGIASSKAITLNSAGGTFLADASTTSTLSGVIGGTGSFTKDGTGTLTLIGENTYSGGTTISGGTLQLGNGGTNGSIVGNVTDNGALAFNHSGAKKTFDGVISGTGSLVKLGTDILELTADNLYSGSTTIEDGVLIAGVPIAGQETSFAPAKETFSCWREPFARRISIR